jgi:hypothetical protein
MLFAAVQVNTSTINAMHAQPLEINGQTGSHGNRNPRHTKLHQPAAILDVLPGLQHTAQTVISVAGSN